LVQFGARWFRLRQGYGGQDDASTGRWLSKDPILLEGGFNLYVFCGNDPVNYVDPMGLWFWGTPKNMGTNSITMNTIDVYAYDAYKRLKSGRPGPQFLFDTDLFDGFEVDYYYDLDGNIFRGDDINYLGIGMYDAWKGNSLEWSRAKTALWKAQYNQHPSRDVLEWLEYGYNLYDKFEHPEKNVPLSNAAPSVTISAAPEATAPGSGASGK